MNKKKKFLKKKILIKKNILFFYKKFPMSIINLKLEMTLFLGGPMATPKYGPQHPKNVLKIGKMGHQGGGGSIYFSKTLKTLP